MVLEPERRPDGKCACGCGRKLQTASEKQRLLRAHLGREPFATARCCRAYYGVVLSQPEQERNSNNPSERSREWADRSARSAYGADKLAASAAA